MWVLMTGGWDGQTATSILAQRCVKHIKYYSAMNDCRTSCRQSSNYIWADTCEHIQRKHWSSRRRVATSQKSKISWSKISIPSIFPKTVSWVLDQRLKYVHTGLETRVTLLFARPVPCIQAQFNNQNLGICRFAMQILPFWNKCDLFAWWQYLASTKLSLELPEEVKKKLCEIISKTFSEIW